MYIHQTQMLKEATKKPTKLDVARITYQRIFSPTKDAAYSLKSLEAGAIGEQIVFDYLEKYGNEDWIVIRNMWVNYNGPFEGDLILLTNHGLYLFEVKNYSSEFIYEDGISTFNGQINSGNPVNQTRRNTINLQNICNEFSNRILVRGVLVLVGLDNYVEINSEVPDIEILQRNQFKRFIKNIVKRENEHKKKPINKKYLLKKIEAYEIEPYHGPKSATKDEISHLRKGIYCLNCKSFEVDVKRKNIECACGFYEERETAIVRTVCEYGVLTFDKNFKMGEIMDFLDNKISHVNLRKVLKKYFDEVGIGKYTTYINKSLPHYKLNEELESDSQVVIRMNLEEFYTIKKKLRYTEDFFGLQKHKRNSLL